MYYILGKLKLLLTESVERYGLDHHIEDEFEGHMYYDWLLSQEQKIQKIEENIISIHKKLDSMERK